MGVLKVELVEARNLVAKDIKLIGKSTSDPYVKLTVGRNKYTSSVVKKNLAPRWNQTFEFPVEGPHEELLLEVFDHDLLTKDDSIGSTRVGLSTLYRGAPADMWLKLQGVRSGEVRVILTPLDFGNVPPHQQQQQQHYAPPPQQQQQQHYAPPPQQQQYYAPPPQQQHYAPPPQQQHYAPPPQQYQQQQPHMPYPQPMHQQQQPAYGQAPPMHGHYPPQQQQRGALFAHLLSTPIHSKDAAKRALDELDRIYDQEKSRLKHSGMSKDQRKPLKKDLKSEYERVKDILKAQRNRF